MKKSSAITMKKDLQIIVCFNIEKATTLRIVVVLVFCVKERNSFSLCFLRLTSAIGYEGVSIAE
jgi:hypothetical protein